MTMPMNFNPQYITDKDGNKISVILPIEEFNSIIGDNTINSLAHLENHIADGLNSPIIEQSHKEIFQELKNKYA
jgi:hypothetical protein